MSVSPSVQPAFICVSLFKYAICEFCAVLLSLWLLLVAFQICVDLTRVATISCEQLKELRSDLNVHTRLGQSSVV